MHKTKKRKKEKKVKEKKIKKLIDINNSLYEICKCQCLIICNNVYI